MITIEEQLPNLSQAEIDALPVGVIRLDRNATIIYFNLSQAKLARRDAAATIGLNFFDDVAPCTAVKSFQGRFLDFVAAPTSRFEPFHFIFQFPWGAQHVYLSFVWSAQDKDSFYIVVDVR